MPILAAGIPLGADNPEFFIGNRRRPDIEREIQEALDSEDHEAALEPELREMDRAD